ncbi:MAG: large subunit ribosomal protein L3 [Parcubacteria group bacterium Athens0714_24]|nr:MAG: large subunit ribosomal protein L3 [Parcubacteria group bacterium Athens0714_24]
MKFILGKKIGMTQIFDKEENAMPVTIIEAGPCFVTQIKSKEKDGYEAVQIGFEKLKEKKVKKSQKGKEYKYLEEFAAEINEYKVGDKIDVSKFAEGDKIRISGTSKGRGFQGVVKRHGFKGGWGSHGAKHSARQPGSIGASFPERVIKGMRMAGHMGAERVTLKNLKVAAVDVENNLLVISGAVPGPANGLVEIQTI